MNTDIPHHTVRRLWEALVELEHLEWRAMPVGTDPAAHRPQEDWEIAIAAAHLAQDAWGEATQDHLHPPALSAEVDRLPRLCQEIENRTVSLTRGGPFANRRDLVEIIHDSVALTRKAMPGAREPAATRAASAHSSVVARQL